MKTKKTKFCPDCGTEQPIEIFYLRKNGYFNTYCRQHNSKRIEAIKQKVSSFKDLINHCPPEPNTYFDQRQKEQVFKFLEMLGWEFNEEKTIWYKEGIKDKDGNWLKIQPKPIEEKKKEIIIEKKQPKEKKQKNEYYENNKEQFKKYYQQNKERIKEYYQQNKERI